MAEGREGQKGDAVSRSQPREEGREAGHPCSSSATSPAPAGVPAGRRPARSGGRVIRRSGGQAVRRSGGQAVRRSGGQRCKLRTGALSDQGEDTAGSGQVLGGYPSPDAGGDGGCLRAGGGDQLMPWGVRTVFGFLSESRNTSAAARTVMAFPVGSCTTVGTTCPSPQIAGPLHAATEEHHRRSRIKQPQIWGCYLGDDFRLVPEPTHRQPPTRADRSLAPVFVPMFLNSCPSHPGPSTEER